MDEYREKIEQLLNSIEETSVNLGLELAQSLNVDIQGYLKGIGFFVGKHSNNITAKDFVRLAKQDSLYFSNRELKNIPHQIGHARSLTRLYLNDNQLNNLPKSIDRLKQLVYLHLRHNQFNEIPEGVFMLQNLNQLFVNGNKIASLPSQIGNLRELRMLSLSNNKLRNLPVELRHLKKLNMFFIDDNSLDFSLVPKILLDPKETPQIIVKALVRLRGYQLRRK